jgi:proline iminopeptidase
MSGDDPLSPGEHVMLIEGLRQAYHVVGSGPVCVVHSGGPGAFWSYLEMPLVERFLTMVYLEPMGTGASGRRPAGAGDYTLDKYAFYFGTVVERLGVSSVYALGHAHGGFAVQRYAMRRPGRLAGLILYGTAVRVTAELVLAARQGLEAMVGRLAHRLEMARVAEAWRAEPSADGGGLPTLNRHLFPAFFADYWKYEEDFEPLREALLSWRVPGAMEAFDHRGGLVGLDVPTLVLAGRHDFVYGPQRARELREAVPGADLVLFEDSGHLAHFEEPEAFAAAVWAFARRASGAAASAATAFAV